MAPLHPVVMSKERATPCVMLMDTVSTACTAPEPLNSTLACPHSDEILKAFEAFNPDPTRELLAQFAGK